jgi:ABC-2 type transport system permease protein
MTAIAQSYFMTQRHARQLLRQPWFVMMTLIQPVIWLLLFGSLFRSVTEIPGFASAGTYLDYLVPGIIVMTALMGSGWSGMGVIEDIDRGLLDRFLAGPTHRSSLIVGRIGYEAIALVIQGLIMGGLAWLLGARFAGGPVGFAVLLGVALLVAFAFASLSCATALALRQRESVIGVNTMLTLPLTFLSAAFIPLALAPDWIEVAAAFNPINWAIEAGREALLLSPDWSVVLPRIGGLAVVVLLSVALATRAFRGYQRSV